MKKSPDAAQAARPRRQAGRRWVSLLGLLLTGLLNWPCHAQTDAVATRAPAFARPLTLTLTGGIGTPYGNGLDVGYRLSRRVEATAGGGYDWSGFKAGVGARVDLLTEHKATTFAGINLAYSGGRDALTVHTEADRAGRRETARIRLRSGAVARLRVGLRWQPTPRLALLTVMGKGLAFGPNPVQYLDGAAPSEDLRALVNTRRPDSIELSLAVAVRLRP
ncbi:hypothetical protein [Hymenobacter psychrotolerans]|uniref:Outer membrane protein beta-barrel domain-containing protein n=1 Tax=Hymenobacter psychrotolerans DSM 18569 TaxID=1121959 RepID=A0A1M6ZNX7_9BACT|nr:hypothetical protein [Hymenobacter psychrotolerans]SHL32043.1 hypothetical protein SAMN02746009_02529 [Hymenobacter psychrotolerans DSM 18569]